MTTYGICMQDLRCEDVGITHSDMYFRDWMVSKKNYRAVKTHEFRCPKKNEWYLSGALPTAYRAPNDLSQAYGIMRLVKRVEVFTGAIYENVG